MTQHPAFHESSLPLFRSDEAIAAPLNAKGRMPSYSSDHRARLRVAAVEGLHHSAHLQRADGRPNAAGIESYALPGRPHQVFVVHGDPAAADALRLRIEKELRWPALVPEHGATWPV